MGNVGGTMVGAGDAYYNGQRMSAAEALARAGLQPIAPFAADDAALVSTNAFTAGQAALLVHDTKRMLDWAELSYAMDLQGMNSSVTPIASIVQLYRPFPFQNQSAARTLRAIGGSYLFNADPNRIIQDPESLRASSQRNGSAWEALQRLKQQHADPDQLLRSQPGGGARRLAVLVAGARDAVVHAVPRRRRAQQPGAGGLHPLQRQLGSDQRRRTTSRP